MGGGGSTIRDINAISTPYQNPIIDNQNLIITEDFRIRSDIDLSKFFLIFIIILFLLLYYLSLKKI